MRWPNPGDVERGSLYEYTKNAKTYRDPADKSTHVLFRKTFPSSRSYSLNMSFNAFGKVFFPKGSRYQMARKWSDLNQPGPSKVFTFVDVNEKSIDTGEYMPFNLSGAANWLHMPTDRHRGGANIAFADSHVEYKKWQFKKDFEKWNQSVANEQDRADLDWFKQHMPLNSSVQP
jgi:prepilin-type processing-associated H-X9-DG protein